MSFFDSIKSFFTAGPNKGVPPDAREFSNASIACEPLSLTVGPFSTLANHRCEIASITERLEATRGHDERVKEEYNEIIAQITNPLDFQPYTAPELIAHTAAMERYTQSFDYMTGTFMVITPARDLYPELVAVYDAFAACYKFHADSYYSGVLNAQMYALRAQAEASCKRKNAAIGRISASGTAQEKAENAKATLLEREADQLELSVSALYESGEIAYTKALLFRTRADSFTARAEAALCFCTDRGWNVE